MKRAKVLTIYDNYDLFNDNAFDYAREILSEILEKSPDEVTEKEITEQIYDCDSIEWEETESVLNKYFDNSENGFIIFGAVGRWNGTFDGGDIFKDSKEFWNNDYLKDCDYIRITDENGHLNIMASHHDGTNHFEIKELTSRGREVFEKWEYDYDNPKTERKIHNTIIKNNFFSRESVK